MPPSSRIPPLLQPLVRTPKDDSLLLVTGTLDASANWLVARFLYDALSGGSDREDGNKDGGPTKVVLVSWMRDYDFWRQEVRKGTGLDLGSLRTQGRFTFVDGLSALFLPADGDDDGTAGGATGAAAGAAGIGAGAGAAAGNRLPTRPGAPPGRLPPPPGRTPPTPAHAHTHTPPRSSPAQPGLHTLSSASLDHVAATVTAALASLRSPDAPSSTLVVLDNPDLLLAAVPSLTPSSLASLFLTIHSHQSVSHLLVHLQSDLALLTPSLPPQPLQIAQQNLVVKTAHMSAKILGVRLLDTGVARDVSGVLRATVNKDSWATVGALRSAGSGGRADADPLEEMGSEVLYKVHGDGSVKVFERGTAAA